MALELKNKPQTELQIKIPFESLLEGICTSDIMKLLLPQLPDTSTED